MRQLAVLTMRNSGLKVQEWGRCFARQWEEDVSKKNKIKIDTFDGQGFSSVRFTFPSEQTADSFILPVSRALSEWVVNEAEPQWIRLLIRKECGRVDEQQLHNIEAYCRVMMAGDGDISRDGKQAVKEEMALHFADGFRSRSHIVVEGTVRFRMKRYMKHLQTAVEHAVEEFIMEQQYQEFVSMLRYFIFAQDSKVPVAHVLHRDDCFQILDAQLRPLEPDASNGLMKETVKAEDLDGDMIVSRLISLLPQKIYIHTDYPELRIIQTIRHIFADRAEMCTGSHLLHSPTRPKPC